MYDTFERYYQSSPGTFVKQTGQTQWDNSQYNDTSSGLVSMTASKYSFQDFWIDSGDLLVSVYATDEYTLPGDAIDANRPLVPDRIGDQSLYIGRIIFQEGGSSAERVLASFADDFDPGSGTLSHQNLTNLNLAQSGVTYGHIDDQSQTIAGDKTFSGYITYSVDVVTKTASGNALASDYGKIAEFTNGATSYTYTVQPNSTISFSVGSKIWVRKTGTGDITIAKGAGVTFRGVLGDNSVKVDGEDGYIVELEKTDTDEWLVSGNIKPV